MGVSVYATLFVGCKASELPESALDKLARLPVYEEYEEDAAELFEDDGLVSWLDDYAKPIPGFASPLIATAADALDEDLVGFEVASTSRTIEFTEKEAAEMERAKQDFRDFFGFPAKVYLFAEWS